MLRPAWPITALPLAITAAAAAFAAATTKNPATVAIITAIGALTAVFFEAWRQTKRRSEINRLAQAFTAYDPTPSAAAHRKPATTTQQATPFSDRELAKLRSAAESAANRTDLAFRQLTKHARNLEAVLTAIDEPLIATDNNNRVLFCNPSAESLLGENDARQLVGAPLESLFTQDSLLESHRAARAGELRRSRVELTTTLGRRVFQVSSAPVPAAWGTGIFGALLLLRDVTELDAAVRMKTDFVANASHELRTPVAAIRAAAETLEQAVIDDPKTSTRLALMIQSHAAHLQEMIRDLLDLSRLESDHAQLRIRNLSLTTILERLAATFADICQARSLTIEINADEDADDAYTDPDLVALILRNYIENAARFAYQDSTITVNANLVEIEWPDESTDQSQPQTDIDRLPIAATLRLEVIDRGIGIPLQHQHRVFERYYQVEPARSSNIDTPSGKLRRGTGLGLAIVKHAAKSLGGTVGVHSVWKQQTTFWAEIPVDFTPPPPPTPQSSASHHHANTANSGTELNDPAI